MASRKITLSIIIVAYGAKKELFNCLESIEHAKSSYSFEVIVIDNYHKSYLQKDIKNKFPWVLYYKNQINNGYSGGNNAGAKIAKGEFLFFLNPDTLIFKKTLDPLINFLKKDKKAAVVAPILLGLDNKPYQQGSEELTPFKSLFTHTFINKFFPNNPISKKYFLSGWNKKDIKKVDVVPGTALMIRKEIFEKINGFDASFFLYFEEFDLCKRVKEEGYKMYINPLSKVTHLGESTTKRKKGLRSILNRSRFYFFRKHYGLIQSVITEALLRVSKEGVILFGIISIAAFLMFFRLRELMLFIGDQAWFYLSARDFLIYHNIPLVGIASSHSWLHQGAIWTYLLAFVLRLFHFDPVAGAYLTAFLGICTLLCIYLLGSKLFSRNVGILSALFYATSPLTVYYARFAYHTSVIPLFTVFFIYFSYRWVKGNLLFFPLSIFTLGLLYGLELANVSMIGVVAFLILYCFYKKKIIFSKITSRENLNLSIAALLISIFPFLIYDIGHGLVQTFGFAVWIFYRLVSFPLKLVQVNKGINLEDLFSFLLKKISLLFLGANPVIAILLFFGFFWDSLKRLIKEFKESYLVIFLSFIFPALAFFASGTISDAYIPILFPPLIIMESLFFNYLLNNKKIKYFALLSIMFICAINVFTIVKNSYSYTDDSPNKITMSKRIEAAKKIIYLSGNEDYNIVGQGWLSQYPSYILNYEYLTWWLGKKPVKSNTSVKIFISEDSKGVHLAKITSK